MDLMEKAVERADAPNIGFGHEGRTPAMSVDAFHEALFQFREAVMQEEIPYDRKVCLAAAFRFIPGAKVEREVRDSLHFWGPQCESKCWYHKLLAVWTSRPTKDWKLKVEHLLRAMKAIPNQEMKFICWRLQMELVFECDRFLRICRKTINDDAYCMLCGFDVYP